MLLLVLFLIVVDCIPLSRSRVVSGPSPFRLSGISLVEDCGKAELDRSATALSRLTGDAELWKRTHMVAQRRCPRIPLLNTKGPARCHLPLLWARIYLRQDLDLPRCRCETSARNPIGVFTVCTQVSTPLETRGYACSASGSS